MMMCKCGFTWRTTIAVLKDLVEEAVREKKRLRAGYRRGHKKDAS
ncbi:MAG: hypothetical protein QXF49_00760 [Thermosphaera sp.]